MSSRRSRTTGLSANGTQPVQRGPDDVLESTCCGASIEMVPGDTPIAACQECEAELARGVGGTIALLNH